MSNQKCKCCNTREGVDLCTDCKDKVCTKCHDVCTKTDCIRIVCNDCKYASLRDHYRCTQHR